MREWHGARPVGSTGRWLVLLLAVERGSGGYWLYTYSVRPGVTVTITVPVIPVMIPPYDPIYAGWAARLGAASDREPRTAPVPDPGMR